METYEKLRGYIDEHCYSRAKIAHKMSKYPAWVTNVLNGKTQLRHEDFKKVCKVMGTTPDAIESFEVNNNE